MPGFIPEDISVQHAKQFMELYHQPQNCHELFNTWKPILEALDRYHSTNQCQFGCFMNVLTDVTKTSMPLYDAGLCYSKEPIAYCAFLEVNATPICTPNAVLVTFVDPVHGPILQIKAAAPLKAGEMVIVFEIL